MQCYKTYADCVDQYFIKRIKLNEKALSADAESAFIIIITATKSQISSAKPKLADGFAVKLAADSVGKLARQRRN